MPGISYEWNGKKIACIATYNLLEGDNFLDQFESDYLPFFDAGNIKLSTLPYYPKFSAGSIEKEGAAAQMAAKFYKFIVKVYTNRSDSGGGTNEIVYDLMKIFLDADSTICDLAEKTDFHFKFSDE